MIEKVKVSKDQNIIDVVIQEYGSIEGIITFCRDNNLAVDQDPTAESEVKIDTDKIVDTSVRQFFKQNNKTIATGRVA